jgi:glycosyltransferase involved in cell wall biosynthesis
LSQSLDVLLAAEALVPRPGGAERFAVELLASLGERHRVRALILGEPDLLAPWRAHAPTVGVIAVAPPNGNGDGPWGRRRRRGERMRQVVRELLADDPADVVLGQLDAGPGALAGARDAAVPGVLLLAGYEPLCHWAFAPGSRCRPASRCRACPRALALGEQERRELLLVRARHDAALSSAACLVAPSHAMAAACRRICGRRPQVAAPVVRAPSPATAAPSGRVLAVSSVWSAGKGVELLAPIARRLPHRSVLVQAPNGLPPEHRRALAALPNVSLNESASEIAPLLDGAGLLLVPSQHAEPFGRVAFEGLAAGVPTLASATGGLAEFVPSEQLVTRFQDSDAWATAVRALERGAAWEAARRRGMVAAAGVLASRPAARIENWLHQVVAQARDPARALADAGDPG